MTACPSKPFDAGYRDAIAGIPCPHDTNAVRLAGGSVPHSERAYINGHVAGQRARAGQVATCPAPADEFAVQPMSRPSTSPGHTVSKFAVVGTVSGHIYAWRNGREAAEHEALRLTTEGGPR